jgi:hypothetical protein
VNILRGAKPGDASRRRVGLAELDRLVERAGLRVDLETVGTPAGLSVAEELTAYRIVQESLTNTLRHAGPDAKVKLRLEYAPGHVAIEATDDGAGRLDAATTSHGGHGLVGMRERAALHGGTVTAGPRFDGGWTVRATIPRTPPPASGASSPASPDGSASPSGPSSSSGTARPPGAAAPIGTAAPKGTASARAAVAEPGAGGLVAASRAGPVPMDVIRTDLSRAAPELVDAVLVDVSGRAGLRRAGFG